MSERIFTYHYGNEGEQYAFYRIPKALITIHTLNIFLPINILYQRLLLKRFSNFKSFL